MALPESREAENVYAGVSTAGGTNLAQYDGLYLDDTEVADNSLDPGSIGPNAPTPTRGAGEPFDVILA